MYEDNLFEDLDGSGGGGGGGGKGRKGGGVSAPKEANVTLQSRAFATILYLLSEGQVQGSADIDLAKSIYINETVLKNPDNTSNFSNVWADIRLGTPSQSPIPLMAGLVSSVNNVNTKVTQPTPLVRSITNVNATGYSITVSTPALREITDKEIKGSSVRYRVEVSTNGGAYVLSFEDEIAGYTPTGYERTIERPLPAGTSWNIRLTRLTADSVSTSLNNDLIWVNLTTITEAKLRYPNSALFAVKVAADQFSNIPRFALELKGRVILVPHNYNPVTRVYTGVFNGSLVPGYSDNPAWCFYDMATNKRYGLGKYVAEASVDVYALYAIGQYCDQMVPDGKGGQEPRFTCNAYIKEATEAAQLMSDLASVFRGMTYYAGGSVVAVQDSPRTPIRVFNESNVLQTVDENGRITEPTFRYSGTAQRAIHSAVIVYWTDPSDFYRVTPEYVDDPNQIARFGFNPTEIRAFGCTSRGQARRVGEWLLASERYRTQTISFRVPAEGLLMRPNEVIKVYDPLKMTDRRGGRIVSATSTSITIDAPFDVAANRVWTLHFMNPGGLMEIRQITNSPGVTSTFNWSAAQALASQNIPMPNQPWAIESNVVSSSQWQVLSIQPAGDETYEVVAVEYENDLYDYVDRNVPLPNRVTSDFDDPRKIPPAPQSLSVAQSLYETNGASGVKTRLDVSWVTPKSTASYYYNIQWRVVGDPVWRVSARTDQNTYSIFDASYGKYEFRVNTETVFGTLSQWVYVVYSNTATLDPPQPVSSLIANVLDNNTVMLTWDRSPDLDVRVGGMFIIKYTNRIEGASWSDGQMVAEVGGSTNNASVPLRSGTYMVKARDSGGSESYLATTAVLDYLPEVISMNAVHIVDEEAGNYPGTHTDTIYSNGKLQLVSTGLFDQQTGLFEASTGNFDSKGGVPTIKDYGVYTVLNAVDLQYVFTCKLTADMAATVVDIKRLFDTRFGSFDTQPGLFDGDIPQGATATVLVATSNDAINYGDYAPITAADYRARAFKFKVVLAGNGTGYNIEIDYLKIIIDMPDRVESNMVAIPAANTRVNFTNRFNNVPAVGVTIQNGQTGDYATITNITTTGFDVLIRNNLNNNVARTISWIAKGYGI